MKYSILFFGFLVFATLLPVGVDDAAAGEAGAYLYRSRVRADRATAAATVAIFDAGVQVDILEHVDGWYRIRHADGTLGWSADWLLSTNSGGGVEEAGKSESNSGEPKSGRYIYRSNVRSGGDIGASIVATASAGTTIQLLDHKGGWYRVKLADGKIGWSADWLVQTIAEDAVDTTSAASTVGSVHDVIHETVSTQGGVIPDGVDLVQLNEYGLQKINALRADRNLRQLVLDQRWVTTAAEYAAYMGKTGATNHERADGSSMHQWVDAKGMPFTERYSAGGWKTNYFTENIAWGYTDGSTEGVERVLDNTLEFFLGEASYNGAHYRTIYHPDWNSIGLGFYFAPQGGGQYKVFVVMHYGSLVL